MESIPSRNTPGHTESQRPLPEDVRKAAVKFCTPWHLAELAEAAEHGARRAQEERYRLGASGLSVEQFIKRYVLEAAHTRAGRIRANGAVVPDAQRIELALSTFSVEEWERIIERLERPELGALRSYTEAHRPRLRRELGSRLVREVWRAAFDRDTG